MVFATFYFSNMNCVFTNHYRITGEDDCEEVKYCQLNDAFWKIYVNCINTILEYWSGCFDWKRKGFWVMLQNYLYM